MGSNLTWIHLADLHLRESNTWDSNLVLKGLLEDVTSVCKENKLDPDFIFITGDLAFSGKQKEYKLVNNFLDKLKDNLSIDNERCFFVPGNHDIDRSAVGVSAQAIKNQIISESDDNFISKVLSDKYALDAIFAPLKNYANFTPDHCKISPEKPFFIKKIKLENLPFEIAIIGLNSAWFCFDDSKPLLGRQQVQMALDAIDDNGFVIGLIHHPITLLNEWDQEFITDIIDHHFDILLRGHYHRTRLEILYQSPYRCSRISAGSTYSDSQSLNGYNIVNMDVSQGINNAYLRIYRPDGGGIWVEDNIFREPKPGQFSWPISKRFSDKFSKKNIGKKVSKYENKSIWIQVEAIIQSEHVDVAEVIDELQTILGSKEIEIRNVRTGSLWLEIGLPEKTYYKLLDFYISKNPNLSSLLDKYKISFVGTTPEIEPIIESKDKEYIYKKLRVFISSPSDVKAEREKLNSIIDELNKGVAEERKLIFEIVRWETDAIPSIGRPREIINNLMSNIDIYIGILASRFGTPIGSAGSGTEEEFNAAYNSWSKNGKPHILVYFKDSPIAINDIESVEQIKRVITFKERIAKKALFATYRSVSDLENQIRKHLTNLILKR